METMKTLLTRQAVRQYPSTQLTSAQVQQLLQAANAAPVGMGQYENFHLTVVQSPAIIKQLESFSQQQPYYGAPTVIIVSAKDPGAMELLSIGGIVENMALIATELGLASCDILGAITLGLAKDQKLSQKIGIPTGFKPCFSLAVGQTAEPLNARQPTIKRITTNFVD
ncbi:MAG: nitroreductase family protein [Liquorilactobacillus nagelii]|uniref:nitroreductase family protein n=1 Tax=Liquorilactobacillus nagelii TaxID=82688 RepID=UPI0039E95DF9